MRVRVIHLAVSPLSSSDTTVATNSPFTLRLMVSPVLEHRLTPGVLAIQLLVEDALITGILMTGHRKLFELGNYGVPK